MPMKRILIRVSILERIIAKSSTPHSGCWIWHGVISDEGYGIMSAPIKTRKVHRVAFELINNVKLVPSQYLCHHCDNRQCWRPSHMFIGTPQDNATDQVRKIRQAKGITKQRVKMVQKLLLQHMSCRTIHKKTGICRQTIQKIRDGKHWSQQLPLAPNLL